MGLNDAPSAERVHIGFFGLRNAGKSSLVNAVTGQNLSLVSEIKGTTTDPVQKTMELLPIGPVVVIDTPGTDDEGSLGEMRVARARRMLDKTDIAVLVADASLGITTGDRELIDAFKAASVPFVIAFNKCDLLGNIPEHAENEIYVSALRGTNVYELKELIGKTAGIKTEEKRLIGDLISPKDVVVLVTPIDAAAPKGRMILPQQQTIRDILDSDAINVVVKETELADALGMLGNRVKMVVTDSQVFGKVSRETPENITLTSFSILFARYKGELREAVKGAATLKKLRDGDKVLISEGCTHHRQCGDIGTVKLPNWILGYTGKKIEFGFTSGGSFPDDLSEYALVVHCGACMLNEREMRSRIEKAGRAGVPITNYGMTIAMIHGILRRSLSPFPELVSEFFGD